MTPKERFQVKLSLELQKALPPDLAQSVLVELGLAYRRSGRRSLAYQDALNRRNECIIEAFNALPGKPWTRCFELVNRIVSGQLGDDQAGQQLKLAEQIGAKMPTTIRTMSKILSLSK
ncbi:MAG: hypothetical protein M8364_02705 [Methylobacter sp.]|uniref:hypothetical protein n=1 Tax=Methylobacter sp. TaxID=2051955 RepID=UPI00258A5EA4|nr:hypothetical protein [Methylobacter sp.]MCL7419801.1 hypothetical protein [Methylobacter sp.]